MNNRNVIIEGYNTIKKIVKLSNNSEVIKWNTLQNMIFI
jgi:hypothetical protein